jgi:hypothetical protein
MKWKALFVVAVGSLFFGTGCLTLPSVRENQEISQRIRKDMVDFYENMAQTYYLLGYEYFKLYKEATDAKNDEAAKQYLNNARLYKQYYEDLKASVDLMRERFGMPKSESKTPPLAEPPKAPSSNDSITSRTEIIPIGPAAPKPSVEKQSAIQPAAPPESFEAAPVEKKPSVLGRMRFWGKKSEAK